MNQKTYTIGRMAPADIIVSGPGMDTLSRMHASITASPRGGGYYQLVDLDSSNGTFVNRGAAGYASTAQRCMRQTAFSSANTAQA